MKRAGSCPVVQLDNQRRTYGVKDKKLAELIVAVYFLDPHSEKAQRLLNWKDFAHVGGGTSSSSKRAGRAAYFSDIVKDTVQGYAATEPSLTLAQVNKYLDDFATAERSAHLSPAFPVFFLLAPVWFVCVCVCVLVFCLSSPGAAPLPLDLMAAPRRRAC